MPHEVTQAQVAYFQTQKQILFEEFFPEGIYFLIQSTPLRYDLWRDDPQFKKISLNRDLASMVYQLTSVRPIRILFDRIVENESVDLKTSSFQGILMGLLVFEHSILFFAPDHIPKCEGKALLVVFGEVHSVFTYKEGDLFSVFPKKQGYSYGDALSSDDYPLVYR